MAIRAPSELTKTKEINRTSIVLNTVYKREAGIHFTCLPNTQQQQQQQQQQQRLQTNRIVIAAMQNNNNNRMLNTACEMRYIP